MGTPVAAPVGPVSRRFGSFLSVLLIVEAVSGTVQVYFAPLYAQMAAKFHVGIGTLSWSLTAFTLATAVSSPILAKMGDLWGHRRMLRITVALVTVGSVLVAVAPTFALVLIGRGLQGTCYAYLPLMFGLVRSRYSLADTRRAVSYLSSVLIFGILAGMVLVGVLVRYTGGPTWALWLPAIGAAVSLVGLLLVRDERFEPAVGLRLDIPGAVLLGAGMAVLLLGLSEGGSWGWGSGRVVLCLAGGVALLAMWCVVELKVEQPLADLRFLLRPEFLPIYLIGFCIYFANIGGQVAVSTFMAAPASKLGYGLGLSAFQISMWMPVALFVMFLAVLSTARLGRRIGFRGVMVIGAALATVGTTCLSVWHNSLGIFILLYAITAAGAGLIESSTRTLVVDGLRDGEIAIGEGIYELAISVGGAVGAAVLGSVMSAHASPVPGLASEHGYVITWLVMAAMCAIGCVTAIVYLRARTTDSVATGDELPVSVG